MTAPFFTIVVDAFSVCACAALPLIFTDTLLCSEAFFVTISNVDASLE